MSSYNINTELDLLQSEGESIPKVIVRKLAENKFRTPDTTHLLRYQFNNWYSKYVLGRNPWRQRRLKHG